MNDALTRINLDDLVSAFGWQDRPILRFALQRIFYGAAAKFAAQMMEFDRNVGLIGLPEAASQMLKRYVRNVHAFGQENLPVSGPALILANHPGMTDTLCLIAALRRTDLKIIALQRPFLQSLPKVSQHLIYLDGDPVKRIAAVRSAVRHLRSGGALLTFPAGQIEPDPDVYPGASESLENWMDSARLFLRFAPETKIYPVLIRSVLWDKAVRHPLTRLRTGKAEQEQLGASFQLLSQILFKTIPVTVRMQIAPAFQLPSTGIEDPGVVHTNVLEKMRTLLMDPLHGDGMAIL